MDIYDVVIFDAGTEVWGGPNTDGQTLPVPKGAIGLPMEDPVALVGGFQRYEIRRLVDHSGKMEVEISHGYIPIAARK